LEEFPELKETVCFIERVKHDHSMEVNFLLRKYLFTNHPVKVCGE